MADFLQTVLLLDPLILWCGYLIVMCIGTYLIVLTHPRVKTTDDVVYYKCRRDDVAPPSDQRASGSIEERQDT